VLPMKFFCDKVIDDKAAAYEVAKLDYSRKIA
jgi:hypothetical protein